MTFGVVGGSSVHLVYLSFPNLVKTAQVCLFSLSFHVMMALYYPYCLGLFFCFYLWCADLWAFIIIPIMIYLFFRSFGT